MLLNILHQNYRKIVVRIPNHSALHIVVTTTVIIYRLAQDRTIGTPKKIESCFQDVIDVFFLPFLGVAIII